MRIFFMGLLLVGCSQSPLLHHLNAADLKESKVATYGCDVVFGKAQICGRVHFLSGPRVNGETALSLTLTDIETSAPISAPVQITAYNYMPDMDHGGFNMSVTQLSGNSYKLVQPCCVMKGRWVLQLKLTTANATDQGEYEFLAP